MKYIFCLIISLTAFSQKAFIKENKSSLDIDSKKNGRCKYTRNQLNKAQLNNIYGTNLKHPLKNTTTEYIQKNFNCIFIARNLRRDSNKLTISPEEVFTGIQQNNNKLKKVAGKVKYLGVIAKKYNYTLSTTSEKPTITVKIFFKVTQENLDDQKKVYEREKEQLIKHMNSVAVEVVEKLSLYKDDKYREIVLKELLDKSLLTKEKILSHLSKRLKLAESVWESGAGSAYNFNFELAPTKSSADFTLKLTSEGSRGPYDTEWSLKWGVRTIAHELGHMMGLDDEYDNALESTIAGLNAFLIKKDNKLAIKNMVCKEYQSPEDRELFGYFRKMSFGSDRATKCDKSSIMCEHIKGVPKKWHIYTILKRFYL